MTGTAEPALASPPPEPTSTSTVEPGSVLRGPPITITCECGEKRDLRTIARMLATTPVFLVEGTALRSGETVLIQAGGSGVGPAVIRYCL